MIFGYGGTFSDTPGEKEVYVVVNQNRSKTEVNYDNNTSERVKVYIKPLLTVTELTTDAGWYGTEEPVIINGKCEGLEVAEADVELYAIQGGSRTVITAKTDEFGRFTARWDHPGTLAGSFLLGGCMPGEGLTTTLAEISLYGMRRTGNSFLTHELEETERKEYYIDLRNPGNLTLSHIRMELVGDVPSNIRFDATTLNGLAANGGEGRIVYHIEGVEASANRKEWETMKVRITSDEGAVIEQLDIEVHVVEGIAAQAQLPFSDRQGDAVEAVCIGDGIGPASGVIYGNAGKGLPAGHVEDVSAEVHFPSASGSRVAYLIGLVGEGDH
jgi:hypothetical protein